MKIVLLSFCMLAAISVKAQLKPYKYNDGPLKLNGFVAVPEKKAKEPAPGILILPAWKGIDNHSKEVAQTLGKLGYMAFIADIYGEGNYPKTAKQAGEISGSFKNNLELYHKRIRLALEQLIKSGADANNIVIIGYCFGGTGALEAAREGMPVKGVVSFHGGLGRGSGERAFKPINPKVLVLHGADDPYVPQKEVWGFHEEMRETNADWQMIYYANAVHAFTEKEAGTDNSKGAAYNEKADKRSWEHFMLFLNEVFKK